MRIYSFILLIFSLSAFSATPCAHSVYLPPFDQKDRTSLTPGESHAFKTLFGTSKMEELKYIERCPDDYWDERKKELLYGPNKVIPHREFCQQFAEEAKERTIQLCKGQSPWFKDFAKIDEVIEKHLREDDPLFYNAKTVYYAKACDQAFSHQHQGTLLTPQHLENQLKQWIQTFRPELSHEYNAKLVWQILPDGTYPIFDNLVMRGQGFYLCSIPTDYRDRHAFIAHYNKCKGWLGLLTHDNFIHGINQHTLAKDMEHVGLCAQEQFDTYCNPETLRKGNIITLSKQDLSFFYNFHELPSVGAFSRDNPRSLLFPDSPFLVDQSFNHIVPYFIDNSYHNWKRAPLSPEPSYTDLSTHGTLLEWIGTFCPKHLYPKNPHLNKRIFRLHSCLPKL